MNNEKGIQTDISMADIQSWYKFLASKKISQMRYLLKRNITEQFKGIIMFRYMYV